MMKKLFLMVGIVASPYFFTACGDSNENEGNVVEGQISNDENCIYTYDDDASTVKWTAFKTTQRLAVGGRFDSVLVELPDSMHSPKEALQNASFSIITSSVFTDNTIRDGTLRNYFFGTLKNDGNISGEIKIVEGNDVEGGGTVMLNINDVKRDVGFKYTIEGNNIVIKTKINLNSFEGEAAVQSLNTECDDLHKGPDGISKLWPDVEIEVKAALKKKC
jgi:polyisoprenoid-binding protein YceI